MPTTSKPRILESVIEWYVTPTILQAIIVAAALGIGAAIEGILSSICWMLHDLAGDETAPWDWRDMRPVSYKTRAKRFDPYADNQ